MTSVMEYGRELVKIAQISLEKNLTDAPNHIPHMRLLSGHNRSRQLPNLLILIIF